MNKVLLNAAVKVCRAALTTLKPEAKRELASQLLTMASKDEGYSAR